MTWILECALLNLKLKEWEAGWHGIRFVLSGKGWDMMRWDPGNMITKRWNLGQNIDTQDAFDWLSYLLRIWHHWQSIPFRLAQSYWEREVARITDRTLSLFLMIWFLLSSFFLPAGLWMRFCNGFLISLKSIDKTVQCLYSRKWKNHFSLKMKKIWIMGL